MKNLFLIILFFPLLLLAQEDKKEEALPPRGTLATAGDIGSDVKSNEGPWGGINLQDDEIPPLTANISKISGIDYSYTVTNNSDDRYNGVIYIEQVDKEGRKLKNTPVSINLAGKDKLTRSFKANPSAAQVSIQLSRWKSSAKKKSEDELNKEIEAKKEEIKKLESEAVAVKPTLPPTIVPEPTQPPQKIKQKVRVF